MYLLFMFLRPQVKKICLGISFCHGSHGIIRFWAWYRWDGLSISFYRMTHYKFLLCISIFFIVHFFNLTLSLLFCHLYFGSWYLTKHILLLVFCEILEKTYFSILLHLDLFCPSGYLETFATNYSIDFGILILTYLLIYSEGTYLRISSLTT